MTSNLYGRERPFRTKNTQDDVLEVETEGGWVVYEWFVPSSSDIQPDESQWKIVAEGNLVRQKNSIRQSDVYEGKYYRKIT